MLAFICPFCEALLRVEDAYLGMRGKCNKCGGNIALIGKPGRKEPQVASVVMELADGREPRPATQRQLAVLKQLGATTQQINGLNIIKASHLIEHLAEKRQQSEPPTENQLKHLKRLGATKAQFSRLKSKAEAAQLIEDMHLSPTRAQLEELKEAGASGAQIAALKSKGRAEALIEELRSQARSG
jgi:hypothetical protein